MLQFAWALDCPARRRVLRSLAANRSCDCAELPRRREKGGQLGARDRPPAALRYGVRSRRAGCSVPLALHLGCEAGYVRQIREEM